MLLRRATWAALAILAQLALLSPDAVAHASRGLKAEAGSGAALHEQLKLVRGQNKVLMAPVEQSLIEQYLEPHHNMLEWGSGYSTLWLSQFVGEYYSIEHHQGWYDDMKDQVAKLAGVHYMLAHVPDGNEGWKGGYEEGNFQQFKNYIAAVDQFGVESFDRVLVDGRARTSCAEYVLKFLKPDSIVFIHDYMPRSYYHAVVHKYYTVIAAANEQQSLVVLRPKAEAIKAAQSGEIQLGSILKHRS